MLMIVAISFTFVSIHGSAHKAGESVVTVTEEQKRFDFNRDGRLSENEKEIMFETLTREEFTGVLLNEHAIREISNGRAGRFGAAGHFVPGRGARRVEKLFERFDIDSDGELSNFERSIAREHIRERRVFSGESRFSRTAQLNTTFEADVKASEAGAVDTGTGLYDENVLRTFYIRFYDEDWYAQLSDF